MEVRSQQRNVNDASPNRLRELLITHNCRRYLDATDINPLHYLMAHCSGEALVSPDDCMDCRRVSRFDLQEGEVLYIVSDQLEGQTTLMLAGDWAALGAAALQPSAD